MTIPYTNLDGFTDSTLDGFDGLDGFDSFDGFDGFDAEDPAQFLDGMPGVDGFGDFEFESLFETATGGMDTASAKQAAMLMEMVVDQLAEAEGEQEVDDFFPALAALAPMAMKALPMLGKAAKVAAPMLKKAVPHIGRAIMSIGRRVAQNPQTRELVRALPTVARNTTAQVLRDFSQGKPVNRQTVARAAAGQAARVLRNPQRCRAAIQHNRAVNNRPARPVRFA